MNLCMWYNYSRKTCCGRHNIVEWKADICLQGTSDTLPLTATLGDRCLLFLLRASPETWSNENMDILQLIAERQGRIDSAIGVIEEYGDIEGEHHKQWVIDQVLRRLLDAGYDTWRDEYEAEDDEGEVREWDTGVAP